MANRKRNIQIKFYVTEDEKRLIDEKMSQLPTRRYGAYLRKMAIDGYIIYTDTADIKAFTKELSAIGRNINQIAKRINAGGPAYQADMDEIRERLDQIPGLPQGTERDARTGSCAEKRRTLFCRGKGHHRENPDSINEYRRGAFLLGKRPRRLF